MTSAGASCASISLRCVVTDRAKQNSKNCAEHVLWLLRLIIQNTEVIFQMDFFKVIFALGAGLLMGMYLYIRKIYIKYVAVM